MKNTDASTVPTLYHLFANKTSALSLLADGIARPQAPRRGRPDAEYGSANEPRAQQPE
jgi:hypothetical protein